MLSSPSDPADGSYIDMCFPQNLCVSFAPTRHWPKNITRLCPILKCSSTMSLEGGDSKNLVTLASPHDLSADLKI